MANLRLAFMGSADFALPAADALSRAGHDIACVYSQPPRPAGRGQEPRATPVHGWARERGLTVRTPDALAGEAETRAFAELDLDLAVVAAYGLILPRAILEAPRLGCLNIHASLLPRWRGAAPVERAIMAGDSRTGVAIMAMDEGLDTGAILLEREVEIAADATGGALEEELARLGAALLLGALEGLAAGTLAPAAQATEGITHAAKLRARDCRIDWNAPAADIERQVRALNPSHGAWFEHDGARVKVWSAEVVAGLSGPAGETLDDRLTVACGEDALRLAEVQRAGKRIMAAEEMLRGAPLAAGSRLA